MTELSLLRLISLELVAVISLLFFILKELIENNKR